MSSRRSVVLCLAALAVALPGASRAQQPAAPPRALAGLAALKREAAADVDAHARLTQQIVDQLYSYGELGYQEVETSRYLVQLLRDNGFAVEQGIAGLPTAWIATWGSGKPVLSLGADLDDIPQASQVPGVACHLPLVDGAPGHGEGHNAGPAVNIVAALAVKRIMERDHLPGTLKIWPGVAEELGGGKAFLVRAGYFKDTDIVLFAHVASMLETGWGDTPGTGNISVLYSFKGQSAHAAVAPWRGRSALDAVELMDVGWNFRREHLRPAQRSHYVIKDGGDQPNVVPSTASVWYYLRELDGPHIAELFAIADSIARGAALMTGTSLASERILGSAWPGHFNKVVAQSMYENIKQVGLPQWSAADQTLAKAVQRELHVAEQGLDTSLAPLPAPPTEEQRHAGFSDDIGDVSWNVPTVVLLYPSNIPNLPGHNWSNGITMATPIAHKGASAGAKVQAMTLLDFLLRPELVQQAWDYFRTVQTKTIHYTPLIRPDDQPALELNVATMEKYRPAMRKLYYEPTKYATYLEQLGVPYPTLRQPDGRCVGGPAR
jgi:aminobenzoyl-glutamate utilization protein B